MYLKSIEIQGFKSFADRHVFHFDKGISAIVGPNGSGKSNIVDAIRWALGEQSAKSLRGGKMEDVIFSGSSSRKAVGMAKVSLILDNCSRELAIDRDEVEIQRALHRSGESDYRINRQSCRLKDIHELLMDTGIGRDGLSVIGQGKIDEVLLQHAEERRSLIEEAAGISKYKYRKREAQRRLDATHEDMDRLDDVLYELEERLPALSEQAEKVRSYRALDEEERALFLADVAKNYTAQKEELEERSKQLEEIGDRRQVEIKERLRLATKRLESLEERDALRSQLDADQAQVLEFSKEQQSLEASILLQEEKLRQSREEKTRLKKEKKNIEEEEEKLRLDLAQAEDKAKEQKKDFQAMEATLAEAFQKQAQQDQALSALKISLEDARNRQFQLLNERADLNNERTRILQSQNGYRYRQQKHGSRLADLEDRIAKSQEENSELRKAEAEEARTLERLLDQMKHTEEEQIALKERTLEEETKHHALLQEMQGQQSRLETIKELEEAGEGYYAGVRAVLQAQKSKQAEGVLGTVGQVLDIPEAYVTAFDIALGGSSQNVLVENDGQAARIIEWLKQERRGRVTFMPLNTIQSSRAEQAPEGEGLIGNMADLAQYEPAYEKVIRRLLGRTWLVKDLESARRIAKRNKQRHRLVTLEGDLLAAGGSMTGGLQKRQGQLLRRRSEITRLQESLHQNEISAKGLQQSRKKAEQRLSEAAEQKQKLREDIENLRLEHSAKLLQLEARRQDIARLEQEMTFEKDDQQVLNSEMTQAEEKLRTLDEASQTKNEELVQIEHTIRQAEEDLRKREEERALDSSQRQEEELIHAREAEKMAYAERQLEDLRFQARALQESIQGVLEGLRENEDQIRSLDARLAQDGEASTKLAESYHRYEQDVARRKDEMEEVEEALRSLEASLEASDQRIKEWDRQIQEEGRLHDRIAMQITRYEDNLRDHYDLTFEQAMQEADLDLNTEHAGQRIRKLRAQKQAFGELNFTAPEEYKHLQERTMFLSKQLTDLQEGKEKLEKVIAEMEATMTRRFRKTFDHVNRQFQRIFVEMFEGGQAELALSLPDNLLESGIDIIAKPPGKKASVLSLLSGGERAMTAIALLFSIQEVRPSPFVVLDEIEAALDAANIRRFTRFLKRYAEHTQFIIISHRRGTMAAAEVLYGISMDKSGVSSQVSVHMSEEGEVL